MTGPESPYERESLNVILPTPTRRLFQILFVVNTAYISVSDLKQSRAKSETSKKN